MLNKELLMQQPELPPVTVTLGFYGGQNSGTFYSWVSPDGSSKTSGVFDERVNIVVELTCKQNTIVSIQTDDYRGNYTATPPQDITVDTTSSTSLTFTAFRDVWVVF